MEHAYSTGLGVDCLDTAVSRVDWLRHVEGVGIMVENKKIVVATLIGSFLVVAILGFAITEYYGNVVRAERGSAYSQGHVEGYLEGYDVGNETGYQIGYELGFSNGNMSGYDSGYDIGYEIAYEEAYNTGLLDGEEVGFASGYEQGYDNGYAVGLEDGAGHGYIIRDPTYQEALQFINDDRTDANQYDDETYTCYNFAADFEANAFRAGYRCGFVLLEWIDGYAHAMVCFDTIDKGLIYIEPQDDEIVPLKVGSSYWGYIVIYIAIIW